jgi:radical SAM protein with 4Fe4S-binding SPASM domain
VAHGHEGIPGQQELSLVEIQGILDQVVDEGCLWFLLTGGEPLMRKDFKDIYLYAKRKGLIVTLFTNGTLLTPRMADFLAEWRPFVVEITLYGYTQETYERITGIPGSHARCMRGIELLMERKVPLKLKTMVLQQNRHELKAMQDYAEELGVDFRYDSIVHAGICEDFRPFQTRLTPQEIVNIEIGDLTKRSLFEPFIRQKLSEQREVNRNLYTCLAGLNSFHIDPYGDLFICMTDRQFGHDLRKYSFSSGWHGFFSQLRNLQYSQGNGCIECRFKSFCGQCPGFAWLEHGNPVERVEFLCELTHLRAQVFGE